MQRLSLPLPRTNSSANNWPMPAFSVPPTVSSSSPGSGLSKRPLLYSSIRSFTFPKRIDSEVKNWLNLLWVCWGCEHRQETRRHRWNEVWCNRTLRWRSCTVIHQPRSIRFQECFGDYRLPSSNWGAKFLQRPTQLHILSDLNCLEIYSANIFDLTRGSILRFSASLNQL